MRPRKHSGERRRHVLSSTENEKVKIPTATLQTVTSHVLANDHKNKLARRALVRDVVVVKGVRADLEEALFGRCVVKAMSMACQTAGGYFF